MNQKNTAGKQWITKSDFKKNKIQIKPKTKHDFKYIVDSDGDKQLLLLDIDDLVYLRKYLEYRLVRALYPISFEVLDLPNQATKNAIKFLKMLIKYSDLEFQKNFCTSDLSNYETTFKVKNSQLKRIEKVSKKTIETCRTAFLDYSNLESSVAIIDITYPDPPQGNSSIYHLNFVDSLFHSIRDFLDANYSIKKLVEIVLYTETYGTSILNPSWKNNDNVNDLLDKVKTNLENLKNKKPKVVKSMAKIGHEIYNS